MKRYLLSCAIVLLATRGPAPLGAQTGGVEVRIASETLPAGSLMQIKVQLTSPMPITSGGMSFEMDSGVFEGVAGVALFSPDGDSSGAAVLQGRRFNARFTSPKGTFGTLPDYPILTIAAPLRRGLPLGAQYTLMLDPNASFWNDLLGGAYPKVITPGTLTIGDGVAITNVVPGGGLLPAGTTVRVLGANFSAQTTIQVNEIAAVTRYVSPSEIDFTLPTSADLTGTRFRARNPDGSRAVYYSYLRTTPMGASARALLAATEPIFSNRTVTSAGLTLPAAPASGFVAVALQNNNLSSLDIVLELQSASGSGLGRTAVTLPAATRYARTVQEIFGVAAPVGSVVRVSAPASFQVLGLSGDEAANSVIPLPFGAAPPPATPQLTLAPGVLTFNYQTGSAAPTAQSLSVGSTGAALSFTAAVATNDGGGWLTVNPSSGTTPATLSVSVNPAGLATGTRTGTITVTPTGGTAQSATVTLNINAPPVTPRLTLAPGVLTFNAQTGSAAPAAQSLSVGSTGAALSFTAVAATNDGGGWLAVNPSSGATPAVLSVSVNPAGLAAGARTGTITVTPTGGTAQSATVTLNITAPPATPPVFSAMVNAASQALGSIAPGELITIYGSALGPAAPAGLRLTAAGDVDTEAGGARVWFGTHPAPITYAASGQINAVVPYEVADLASVGVQVEYQGLRSAPANALIVDAAPAVFTVSATGRGPGAVLNQDNTLNLPSNPAARGSVVQIYATGEGQTNPPGLTGSVTGPLLRQPRASVRLTVGGITADLLYAGSAPGLVAGVLQINARIPDGVAPGPSVPIVLSIGNRTSPEGVTIAVQ